MERRTYLGVAGGIAAFAGCTFARSGTERGDSGGVDGERDDGSDDEPRSEVEMGSDRIRAKVDLHSHLYHGGGQAMADRYEALGFDVLVGTDHHYDGEAYVGRSFDGSPTGDEVMDYQDLEFPGPVLDGIELSADHHVNLLRSENEEIRQINHPAVYGDDAGDIEALRAETGAELVEVNHRGVRDHDEFLEYPTPSDVVRDFEDLHPTATSDAHAVEEIGGGHVVVEVPELTGDAVIRALGRGEYSIGGVW